MRKSTIVLLAALATSCGTALWLLQQLDAERAANAALHQRLEALAQRPEAIPSPAPAETPSPVPAATARATKVVADGRPSSPPATQQSDFSARQRELMKNPAYRKAMRDQRRQALDYTYADLGKVLNLPPEKVAAILDLLADQSVESADLQWQTPVTREEGEDLQRAIAEQERKADRQLEQLLGSSSLNQLKEFQQSISSRMEVNRLRSELAIGSEALRDDQYQPMLEIVSAENQRMNQELQDGYAAHPGAGGKFNASLRTELAVAANKRIVESARSFLSAAQIATVENLYRRQRAQMETQDAMAKVQFQFEADRARRIAGGN